MKLPKNRLLYWPGMHSDKSELQFLLESIAVSGVSITQMECPYDIGLSPDNQYSEIYRWLKQSNLYWDWWIGLSLGAAVAHIASCIGSINIRPKRISLINPFSDREALSREARFNIQNQWNFKPINYVCSTAIDIDLIISLYDDRISNEHGKQLLKCYPSANIRLTELEADHAISSQIRQHQLAKILLKKDG